MCHVHVEYIWALRSQVTGCHMACVLLRMWHDLRGTLLTIIAEVTAITMTMTRRKKRTLRNRYYTWESKIKLLKWRCSGADRLDGYELWPLEKQWTVAVIVCISHTAHFWYRAGISVLGCIGQKHFSTRFIRLYCIKGPTRSHGGSRVCVVFVCLHNVKFTSLSTVVKKTQNGSHLFILTSIKKQAW